MNQIFISSAANTNPISVTLPRLDSVKIEKIKIREYSIRGIPVTAGIPDDLHFNLIIEHQSVYQNFLNRNDYKKGYPLRLTGTFTSESYDTPVLIADFGSPIRMNSFSIRLLTPSDASATFDNICLWLEYE
jgi:hypothetical protein